MAAALNPVAITVKYVKNEYIVLTLFFSKIFPVFYSYFVNLWAKSCLYCPKITKCTYLTLLKIVHIYKLAYLQIPAFKIDTLSWINFVTITLS